MNHNEIVKYLDKNGRTYEQLGGGLSVACAADGLELRLRLERNESGSLFLTAELPVEVGVKYTEDVITAVNSANAFANFGGFALSPADQTVRYRTFIRLRGDKDGELDYLFENAEKTLKKFAPSLCAVCEGKLTANEFSNNLNKASDKNK